MNKEKLKHLPFNLLFCLPSWIGTFMLITIFTEVDFWIATMISFYFYLLDVTQSSENDYLEERIKKLEDNKK